MGEFNVQLVTVPLGSRPITGYFVVFDIEGQPVVATTAASINSKGEETNPFMDTALLLQTLEGLRPYPE